jgi:hypothetical protein
MLSVTAATRNGIPVHIRARTSIFRYALPLFPLFAVVLGGGWAARSPRMLSTKVALHVAVGLVGQALWVWKLLVFVPPSDYPP